MLFICLIIFIIISSSSLNSPVNYTVSCVQGAIAKSRQFPFRFFSAFEVLNELEEQYEQKSMYICIILKHRSVVIT